MKPEHDPLQTLPAPVASAADGTTPIFPRSGPVALPDDPMQTIPAATRPQGLPPAAASMPDDPQRTLPAPVAAASMPDDPQRTLPAPVAAVSMPAPAAAEPRVAIKIAAAGTRFVQGGYLPVDQMWYELDDGCGHLACYGMVVDGEQQGQPFSIGEIDSNIRRQFREPSYARAVEISQEQYQAMLAVAIDPENGGFDVNLTQHPKGGIAFVWKAMQAGGMNPEGYQGDL